MAEPARRNLLMIAPAMPDVAGNGLAMRIGHQIEALSENWNVHLVVFAAACPTAWRPS